MTELLAPAGSREALEAAVQSGADAVYMGFGAFNARQSARNFTDEEFALAVTYCHLRGVKVYLTLNTLVTDRELPQAAEALRKASAMGVDAVLIQDWGVWHLAREVAPDVTLHASTQMSLHTLGGARVAASLGIRRVVLARELSGQEIREICRGCDAEVEAFVHGALCMCYSGQCAMSALIGQRSGNRGRCAQPCRLPYGVDGPCRGDHPLSLKDANLSHHLRELEDMGVACLKIEGRMKRPEYVAAVTSIYRRLLDERRGPTAEEEKQLFDAFNRDGFTDGYFRGEKGADMLGMRSEKARWPEDWFAQVRQEVESREHRLTPVTLTCHLTANAPAALTAEGGGHTVTVTGAVPEAARNRSLTAEELRQRLGKTGGTVFTVAAFDLSRRGSPPAPLPRCDGTPQADGLPVGQGPADGRIAGHGAGNRVYSRGLAGYNGLDRLAGAEILRRAAPDLPHGGRGALARPAAKRRGSLRRGHRQPGPFAHRPGAGFAPAG